MDISGVDCVAHDWLGCAGIDFDIALPYRFQHATGVEGSLVERRIAVDGSDSEEPDTRVVGGEEKRVGVLYDL